MKAFASISALDRHELDATEHLTDARRAAMSTRVRGRAAPRRGASPLRALAVFMSLVTAAAILLAVVGPSATIVIAATPTPLGPFEYDLRAGPNGGDIKAQTLFDDKLTAKATGTATGTRLDETKATGQEMFKNLTTNDIRIPLGTLVQTTDSPPVRFLTTEEKILVELRAKVEGLIQRQQEITFADRHLVEQFGKRGAAAPGEHGAEEGRVGTTGD